MYGFQVRWGFGKSKEAGRQLPWGKARIENYLGGEVEVLLHIGAEQ